MDKNPREMSRKSFLQGERPPPHATLKTEIYSITTSFRIWLCACVVGDGGCEPERKFFRLICHSI